MSDTSGSFAASIGAWVKKTKDNYDLVCQNAVEEMAGRIIANTPEDKDPETQDDVSIRGDWTSAVDAEPAPVDRGDPTGVSATSDIRQHVRSWKPSLGQTFYIANYSPYGKMLEYGLYGRNSKSGKTINGFSTQASQGMVGIHVEEFDGILEKEARKVSK